MSPRATPRITGNSYSGAQRMTAPRARQPADPYCSKKAAWGLTQAAKPATASMTPLQNSWKQAAELGRLRPVLFDQRRRHALERGVEPHADDAAARADGRGQSVGEMLHARPPLERAYSTRRGGRE